MPRDKPMAIRPVSQGRSKSTTMMLFGDPGVGKTLLIGTGPKTLIIRPPLDHTDSIVGGTAEEWVVRDWDDMNEVHEWARMEKGGGYEWIWLDSATLWQLVGLDDIWASTLAAKPHRKNANPDKLEYGMNQFRFGGWIRNMVGAAEVGGFNFGMTAQAVAFPTSMDDEADAKLMPAITGRAGGAVGGMSIMACAQMNVVGFYEYDDQKDRRYLRTKATDRYYAKDQFTAFGDNGVMVNPTMPKIIDAIAAARAKGGSGARTNRRRKAGATTRRRKTST